MEMPLERLEDLTVLTPLLYSSFSMFFCVFEDCTTAMPFLAAMGGRWLAYIDDNYILQVIQLT